MSDLAQLLFGISAVITATCTGVTGLIAIFRAPRQAARRAAEIAIERALGTTEDGEDDDDADEATAVVLERLLERERRKGSER